MLPVVTLLCCVCDSAHLGTSTVHQCGHPTMFIGVYMCFLLRMKARLNLIYTTLLYARLHIVYTNSVQVVNYGMGLRDDLVSIYIFATSGIQLDSVILMKKNVLLLRREICTNEDFIYVNWMNAISLLYE